MLNSPHRNISNLNKNAGAVIVALGRCSLERGSPRIPEGARRRRHKGSKGEPREVSPRLSLSLCPPPVIGSSIREICLEPGWREGGGHQQQEQYYLSRVGVDRRRQCAPNSILASIRGRRHIGCLFDAPFQPTHTTCLGAWVASPKYSSPTPFDARKSSPSN